MSNLALKSRQHAHLTNCDIWLSDSRCIVLVISIYEFNIELVDIGINRDGLSDFESLVFHLLVNYAFPLTKRRVFVILTDIDLPLLLGINQHQHPLLSYHARPLGRLEPVLEPFSDLLVI
jgi:hypothetical protein